jgi:hypothetical protein
VVGALIAGAKALVVALLNALIRALADVVNAVLSILPNMPALPQPPAVLVTAEGWVAWVFPVGTVLSILGFTITVFLIWQLVAIALRWAKALGA